MFEPRVVQITSLKWNKEDRADFGLSDGFSWSGAKRKDFWNPDHDWEKEMVVGSSLRMWTVQFSLIVGFEIWRESEAKWIAVWCLANDFKPRAEREAEGKAYNDFIVSEGAAIAGMIDEGFSLKEIDEAISDEHSGNTYACALAIGIRDAKDRDKAEKIRVAHNKKYGIKEDDPRKGVVNPCLITIGIEGQ